MTKRLSGLGALRDVAPVARTYSCSGCGVRFADRRAWMFGGLCLRCGEERDRRELDKRLQAVAASIPSAHRLARFDGEHLERWVPSARARMVAERSTMADQVTFHGPSGTGKSTLAVAMLYALIDAARAGDKAARVRVASARFISAEAVGEARSQHALGEGEAPLVELAKQCSLLILDDLGKEQRRRRDDVAEVIRERRLEERPTIITTELDAEAIARTYGNEEVDGAHLMRRLFAPPAVHIRVEVS